MTEERPASIAQLAAPAGGEIIAVANAATAQADHDSTMGILIIAARTATGEYRTVGGGTTGPLRAAVSVAVAAGNTRLWEDAGVTGTTERPVRSLPEIIRTAAEAEGLTSVHVGSVADDTLAAVAFWFEADGRVASSAVRSETLALLEASAERQRESLAARAAIAASAEHTLGDRQSEPSVTTHDGLAGLATQEDFEAALESYESDEVTLVVVDLDDFDTVVTAYGDTISDAVLREISDRLVTSCRREDLIARTGPDTFAVLFSDATRSVGMHVAKRLLDTIALPLPVAGGPEQVTATIVLAHQFGLVDMEELVESADSALASGKRVGPGRLVIAS